MTDEYTKRVAVLLKRIEWRRTNGMYRRCPDCGREDYNGHSSECELGKLLKEGEANK
jgi:4-hydroxy-3-methylbut-2-en-1-yl diphosphate synthase IspG/GcpE